MQSLVLFLLVSVPFSYSQNEIPQVQLKKIDDIFGKLNAATANLAWQSSTGPKKYSNRYIGRFNRFRAFWKIKTCVKLRNFTPKSELESRAIKLLCRGPLYTASEAQRLSEVLGNLREIYQNGKVCSANNCYSIEPDLEQKMRTTRDPRILAYIWKSWRDSVGPKSKILYTELVDLMNKGAERSGYRDVGQAWRDELEIADVEMKMIEIMDEVKPLFEALHAFSRYQLRRFYGSKLVPEYGPIPAHLLGNMWSQNWVGIFDIIYGGTDKNLTNELQKRYTVLELVDIADKFYQSIGFNPVSQRFWKNSKFQNNNGVCHGTAVNMFHKDDFRMMTCSRVNEEDLRVIYHEMGHIQYFMEYQNQWEIFKDGANSAMQETIGDAIALAAFTEPQHERLGIKNSHEKDTDLQLLLKVALMLLPQLPFSLVMDKWRWGVFNKEITPDKYNSAWWQLSRTFQGIAPLERTNADFDPAAKYHINDNTPYARYFFATILQVQFLEAMCKAAVFGDSYSKKPLPMPLHLCDIFGFSNSTATLRKMMKFGSSINFETAVRIVTNSTFSVQPFLNYFQPLKGWLDDQIKRNNIPVGWN